MSQPPEYEREKDFTVNDGDDTDHAALNREFDGAAQSINAIRDNLALIQKDDGSLANQSVGADQLADDAFDAYQGELNQKVQEAQVAAQEATRAAVAAGGSEVDAETAAENAAISEANAAASAENAAGAAKAMFDGLYYGSHSEDPTADPNGAPPSDGDFYFNNVAKLIRVFDGLTGAWVSATPSGQFKRQVFVAGAGFTPGTTTDLDLASDPLTVSNIFVHFDAAYQQPSEYSLSGQTLTFTSPIPLGVQAVAVAYLEAVFIPITNALLSFPDYAAASAAAATLPDGQFVVFQKERYQVEAGVLVFDGMDGQVALSGVEQLREYSGKAEEVSIGGYLWEKNGIIAGAVDDGVDSAIDTSGILWTRENSGALDAQKFGVGGQWDSTAAFNALLAMAAGRVILLPDVVRLDGAVSHTGKVNLRGTGETVIDCSRGGKISFNAGITALPALSADASASGSTLQFTAPHGLVSGDVVVIHNPTAFSWSSHRDYYTDGEMCVINEAESTTLASFFGALAKTYSAAGHNIYKMNGAGVSITGVAKIITAQANQAEKVGTYIRGHKGVRLDVADITDSPIVSTGIEVSLCFDVIAPVYGGKNTLNDAYPLGISNSQKVNLNAPRTYSRRHCIAIGGRSGPGTVPNRDIIISNAILENDGRSAVGSADIHGNVENVKYVNCILKNGAVLSGKNIDYSGCTIYSRNADAVCFFGSEVVGGLIKAENCRLIIRAVPTLSFGVVQADLTGVTSSVTIDMKNITVDAGALSVTNMRFMRLTPSDTYKTKVLIDGLTLETSGVCNSIVRNEAAGDVTALFSVGITNLTSAYRDTLYTAALPANLNCRMRMPLTSGKQSMTTDIGVNNKAGTAVLYPYIYPRTPNLVVSANPAGFSGTRAILPTTSGETTGGFTPLVLTPDATNWSGTRTFNLNWQASICDF